MRGESMEWLEMIKLRTAGAGEQGIAADFLEQMEEILESPGLADARIYAHASVPNDLVITLTWVTDAAQSRGSDLAYNLSRELKRYGLVDHSVWIEQFPKPEKSGR